jgi:hypothetical protein
MNKLNELIKKQEQLKLDLLKELKEKDKKKLSLEESPQIKEQLLARMNARLVGLKHAKQEAVREYDEQIKKYETEVKKIHKNLDNEKKQIDKVQAEVKKAAGVKNQRARVEATKASDAAGSGAAKRVPIKKGMAEGKVATAKKKPVGGAKKKPSGGTKRKSTR